LTRLLPGLFLPAENPHNRRRSAVDLCQPLRKVEILADLADLAAAYFKETRRRQLIALATGVWQARLSRSLSAWK
jgi:hypothetical protein